MDDVIRITLGIASYALLAFTCWLWATGIMHGFAKDPVPYVATFPFIVFVKWRWIVGTKETFFDRAV